VEVTDVHKEQDVLSIVFLNVNGLGIRGSKLSDIITEYPDKDLILLCETWLTDDVAKSLNYDNFLVIYSNRQLQGRARRNSGGLLCLINKRLNGSVSLLDSSKEDILWLQFDNTIYRTVVPLLLGLVYISPEDSSRHAFTNMDIHRELERQVISYSEQGYSCFVVGDFNGRTGLQHDYTEHDTNSMYLPLDVDYKVDVNQLPRRYSADNVVNKFGRELL
jgi:exonuclease III